MSKKVLLVAGVLLAAGSVAAISSPYFRGGQLRLGQLLAEFGDDDGGSPSGRSGRRHSRMDADDGDQIGREDLTRSRRARSAKRDRDGDAEDTPWRAGDRVGRRSEDRARDRSRADRAPGEETGKGSKGEGLFSRLDRNGDGFIDAKELEIWAAERSARASERFLKRFDADGDGKVSRDEFRSLVTQRRDHRGGDQDEEEITEAELAPAKPGRGILK